MKKRDDKEIVLLRRALADADEALKREFRRAEANATKAGLFDDVEYQARIAKIEAMDARRELEAFKAAHGAELAKALHDVETTSRMWIRSCAKCTCGAFLLFNAEQGPK